MRAKRYETAAIGLPPDALETRRSARVSGPSSVALAGSLLSGSAV
jgi:hypothetical protein